MSRTPVEGHTPDRAQRDLHQATRRREDFGESSEETSLQCQD